MCRLEPRVVVRIIIIRMLVVKVMIVKIAIIGTVIVNNDNSNHDGNKSPPFMGSPMGAFIWKPIPSLNQLNEQGLGWAPTH